MERQDADFECNRAAPDYQPRGIDTVLHDEVGANAGVPVSGLLRRHPSWQSAFHLKLSDEKDPSIEFVDKGDHFHLYLETDDASAAAAAFQTNGVPLVKDIHETAWGTREFVIKDDQGHTLYFGESR
jgi:catechol 2,3-dioxygenase-like lactoylglutathione lyase family enzyme